MNEHSFTSLSHPSLHGVDRRSDADMSELKSSPSLDFAALGLDLDIASGRDGLLHKYDAFVGQGDNVTTAPCF